MTLTTKEQIESFLSSVFPVSEENADGVVKELEACRTVWPQLANDWNKQDVFAQVYLSLSEAYFQLGRHQEAVDTLEEGIIEYSKVSKYSYPIKMNMYHNLGVYQCYLGKEKDALRSFRKFVFYSTINNVTYKDIPLYCYRKVNDYTIKDLQKSQITLADPQEFDDPVDCLAFEWMKKNAADATSEGEKLAAKLIKEAFSYVRIKCFVRNAPLPSSKDPKPTSTEKKAEYSNVIMWPTYADYHRGICLEYHLPTCLQQADLANETTFVLQDVDYRDTVELKDEISIKEAFFTKSTEWEFEKETRLLYYDTKSTEKFKSVSIPPDSLKKVFFGLRCEEKDMYQVIRALKECRTVEFYKMNISPEDVYSFVPEKIDGERFCENYERKLGKNGGCICGVVKKIKSIVWSE